MKIFVGNDNKEKYYNSVINRLNSYKNVIEKLQNTLKILQKSYKVVISISLWRSAGISRTGAGVCPQWHSVPVCTSKGAAFEELGAAFGGVGSCVSKGATSKRSVAAVGSYNFRLLKSKRKEKTIDFFIKE